MSDTKLLALILLGLAAIILLCLAERRSFFDPVAALYSLMAALIAALVSYLVNTSD